MSPCRRRGSRRRRSSRRHDEGRKLQSLLAQGCFSATTCRFWLLILSYTRNCSYRIFIIKDSTQHSVLGRDRKPKMCGRKMAKGAKHGRFVQGSSRALLLALVLIFIGPAPFSGSPTFVRSSFPARSSTGIHQRMGQIRCAQAGDPSKDKPTKYADDVMPDVTGSVRLYATHTLCISCLACCCQFKRLLPNVKLEVAFDVWRETRRWVGSGEEVLARFEAQEEQERQSRPKQ